MIIDASRSNLDGPGKQLRVGGSYLRGYYKCIEAIGSWRQALVFNFLKTPLNIFPSPLQQLIESFFLSY